MAVAAQHQESVTAAYQRRDDMAAALAWETADGRDPTFGTLRDEEAGMVGMLGIGAMAPPADETPPNGPESAATPEDAPTAPDGP